MRPSGPTLAHLSAVSRGAFVTIAILSIAGCSSCGGAIEEAPGALQIDAAFSADEQAAIGESNAQWDTVAKPWSGAGWRIEKGMPPHNAAAWTFADDKRIVVKGGHPPRTFRITILHELGHARGLDHVEHGVMQGGEGRSGPSTTEFSAQDIAECRRVHACERPKPQ